DDYDLLLKELRNLSTIPSKIVHAWGVTQTEMAGSRIGSFEELQHVGFYSLLFLAQALGRRNIADPLQLWVLSNNLFDIQSADVLQPEKATLIAPCKVIPQEYTNITCRNIDIVISDSGRQPEDRLIDQLIAEFAAQSPDAVIAYRGNRRWVQAFEPVQLAGEP